MYLKNVEWQNHVNQKKIKMQTMAEMNKLQQCTFKPEIEPLQKPGKFNPNNLKQI
jgi:hypothetical protein